MITIPSVDIYFEPRDLWVGIYYSDDHVYVCPCPTVVFRWKRNPATKWSWDKAREWIAAGQVDR